MVKKRFLPMFFILLLLLITVFSDSTKANSAGVGVVNVPPKYGKLRIVQHEDTIRVYLIVSDYNSWGDILKIRVILEDKNTGNDFAEFAYQQYSSKDSYEKINLFDEKKGNDLLLKEKCSFESSNKRVTIDERCDIEILFVFKSTWFSRLKIVVEDRAGDQAVSELDYYPFETSPDDSYRDENIIIVPWFNGQITFFVPPYLSNLLAVIAGLFGAAICLRKKYILNKRKFNYEKS